MDDDFRVFQHREVFQSAHQFARIGRGQFRNGFSFDFLKRVESHLKQRFGLKFADVILHSPRDAGVQFFNFFVVCVAILRHAIVIVATRKELEINIMNTYARPVRDLRNNYNEIINLTKEGNQVIITQNGREAAVVIGTQAYKEFEVFLHRKYIKNELAKAKEKAKNPNIEWLSEDEFWDGFEETL